MIEIDGIIYSLQRHGGISTYFDELIATATAEDLPFHLTWYNSAQRPPCLETGGPSRPARRLERYRSALVPDGTRLFHSSYYRRPATAVRSVVTVHDFVYERFSRGPRRAVHSLQKGAAIRDADAIICVSQATADDLLEFVGPTQGPIHVIHNGVSEAFQPLPLADRSIGNRPYILYVGARRGYKNFRLVAQALAYLPELELLCVGGEVNEAQDLAGLPDGVVPRIRFLRGIPDEELNRLYNGAVCLAYPSLYEGFGIPVVEAMRAGCPVVVADCRAVLEVAGDAAVVCRDSCPHVFARCVETTQGSARPGLVAAGMRQALGYGWTKTHRRTLAVYQSLLT